MLENLYGTIQIFGYAVLVGILVSAVCSILGVFVVTKRVVFIGITLSEVAACGVATSMIFHFNPMVGAGILTTIVVAILAYPFESTRIPRDAVLGVTFVLAAALSILLVAKSHFGLEQINALLYGNLLFATETDLLAVSLIMLPVLVYFFLFLRPMLYTFLDREMAKVLGMRVILWELSFFFSLGLAVSAASRVAGSMLVFCYLIVSPAAALLFSKKLHLVFVFSAASGVSSTLAGMYLSYAYDLPTSQTIAVSTCCIFLAAVVYFFATRLYLLWRK